LKLKSRGEPDKRKLCEEVAALCLMICEDEDFKNDLYSWGWINGIKDAHDLSWKEVCGECKGCETPICMPKGAKRG